MSRNDTKLHLRIHTKFWQDSFAVHRIFNSNATMLLKRLTIATLIFLSFTPEVRAQQKATIRGLVRDAENNQPLERANVLILGTTGGAATDKQGYYEIKGLRPGEYKLEARMMGYKKQVRGVNVKPGEKVELDFGLLPTVFEMSDVTVEAERREPIPAVRIESAEIRRLAPTTTADILEEVPGVSVSRSGSWGTKPYFQGMTDSRILVFMDGVKTNQACPMGMDACTATIEPDLIENIEVQKGAGSAQYGSGNLGGVIHISSLSSRYSTDQSFKTDVDFVSKYESVSNSRTGTLSLSGGNTKFDFIASISAGRHDDYKTRQEVIENSGFGSNTIHLKTRYRPAQNQQLQFTTQIYRADDIGWPAANTIIPDERRDTYALNYIVGDIAQKLQMIKVNLSYQPMYHNMINNVSGEKQFIGDSRSLTLNGSVDSYWAIGNKNKLLTGVFYSLWKMNAHRSRFDPAGAQLPFIDILPNSSVGEWGIFAQDDYEISNRLKLQAGIRLNHISASAQADTASTLPQDHLRSEESVLSGSAGLFFNLTES
ncbi:MAG: TonB-dependent receptor, partial [bacterium]